jgi:hypothetical protein
LSLDLSLVSRPWMASLVSCSFYLSLVFRHALVSRSLPHIPLLLSRVSFTCFMSLSLALVSCPLSLIHCVSCVFTVRYF